MCISSIIDTSLTLKISHQFLTEKNPYNCLLPSIPSLSVCWKRPVLFNVLIPPDCIRLVHPYICAVSSSALDTQIFYDWLLPLSNLALFKQYLNKHDPWWGTINRNFTQIEKCLQLIAHPASNQSAKTINSNFWITQKYIIYHLHHYHPFPTRLSSLVKCNSWPPKWSPCFPSFAFTF